MYYFFDDKAVQEYISKISIKSMLSFGRNKEILKCILSFYKSDNFFYHEYHARKTKLYQLLWTKNTDRMSGIFCGSEYKVLVTLLGSEWAEKFKKVWDRSPHYIYSAGMERRPFRSMKNQVLYISAGVSKLLEMVKLVANGFSYEKYFSGKVKSYDGSIIIPDLLAIEIDEGNEEVTGRIHEIVYGDTNKGAVTREIIKGILMSRSGRIHKWAGDLLLAARLQEGLRQTIVECMDEGSKHGFLYILKVILENDLLRFSSVVRALDVWTGLAISAQKYSVAKKCLEASYKCLTENGYIDDCLKSSDNMLIYMGLWSAAFDEIMAVENRIGQLLSSSEKYKRLTALCFLSQTQFSVFQHRLAIPLLDDRDYEVKSWTLKNIYPGESRTNMRADFRHTLLKYKRIKGIYDTKELFFKLKEVMDNMPKKHMVFNESVFSWLQISLTCDEIIVKMLLAIAGNPQDKIIDLMLDYRDRMSADTRREFLVTFLDNPRTNRQKAAVVEFMGDRSSHVRSLAMETVEKLKLSDDDYVIIEDLLRYKSGDLRKNAIKVLLRQNPVDLMKSIRRLADSDDEKKILAVLDIIAVVEKDEKYRGIRDRCRNIADLHSDRSEKTKVMSEKIESRSQYNYSAAKGFGLFDPEKEIPLPGLSYPKGFTSKSILSTSMGNIKEILNLLSRLIERYKDYEYETEAWNGALTKVVLGGEYDISPVGPKKETGAVTLESYPLTEVWRKAVGEHSLTAPKLLEVLFYYNSNRSDIYMQTKYWYKKLINELFPVKFEQFTDVIKNLPFASHISTILNAMLDECPKQEIFTACYNMICYIYNKTPAGRFAEEYEKKNKQIYYYSKYKSCLADAGVISFWTHKMKAGIYDDESFKKYFYAAYTLYKASGYISHSSLELEHFEKAYKMGIADENELYAELCGRHRSAENLRILTNSGITFHKRFSSCTKLKEVCKNAVDRIVSIELKRGDITTEVSHLASGIEKCTGTRFFAEILTNIGKDTYVRGYNFIGDDTTKKQIFSHLLKCCYPGKDEDENTLKELLKDSRIKEKQLIDAAMYSPQWIDIIEQHLKWPGLKSACWYFHAHVNETFSNEKETVVARYSPVAPHDFKDGAFDIDWFNDAYSTLGEKRFNVVYNSAKYIAGGGLHKRSQLFADAVLGNIGVEQAEKIINQKRNKNYVLCYGLIPMTRAKVEMLHRYEFLHGFLKESRKFGAQRRESEAKAVSIALDNLARNAGFSDITRFTWYMETEKIRSIERYLRPQAVKDTEIHIDIDEVGRASIVVMKNGKKLKNVPSRLKSSEYVKEIKKVKKSLIDQYSRARVSLEKAMETGDVFTLGEIENLSENPVICPLIQNLVFKSGSSLGYLKSNSLAGTRSRVYKIGPQDKCIIAHPVHLYKSGEWAGYQKDIYDRRIVQPFKQVFRELYRPNEDELDAGTISHRYDGHQIQPKKAAALLKGRGWTASYDEGLQKVYYNENLIARIFAMADWFSPAEIEAPAIEGVQMFDRKTGKSVRFSDVPGIIFSEIMRDVDLAVSVAHVGGVDPEASLSTIEMRIAIISEMLRLLKLGNVQLKGSHAYIGGSLGQYTVHLGSGLAHKMAKGALNILPVHSQHRGRIFLPFVDEDPKTAETVSKIVLLAEDNKIKDPTILSQIVD